MHTAQHLDQARAASLRMIQTRPDDAHAHKLLALADWLGGDAEAGLNRIRAAMVLRPDDADGLTHQGQMLGAQGKALEALLLFRRAAVLRPWDSEILYRMGVGLGDAKEQSGAAGAYIMALICRPDHGEALNNLGVIIKDLGNFERGAMLFRWSTAAVPAYSPPSNNLGLCLVTRGQVAEGGAQYRRALALEPNHADAANNLGVVSNLQGDFSGAVRWCRRALHLRPNYPAAHNNLGNALKDMGALEEAIAAYREAIRQGGGADHKHNLALAVMAAGRLGEGLALYESRWDSNQLRGGARAFAQPRWNGEPGEGVLLLHAEQGFGDSLQFCRYAPLAAARGWRVVLEVPKPLVRLMGSLAGVETVVAAGDPLPDFDVHCPMMSLPLVFGTELDTVPTGIPYLSADPDDAAKWQARLAELGPGLRIGLVWAGNARRHSTDLNATDRRRSMAPETLAPLAEIDGVHLISLQKDGAAPFAVQDWMAECGDFADTAALIAGLDLVIGVDTAVIHLAGALGKPVWLLNRFDSCWRWLREGEASPWYPAMRIYRQPSPGAWDAVVEAVSSDLSVTTATKGCG